MRAIFHLMSCLTVLAVFSVEAQTGYTVLVNFGGNPDGAAAIAGVTLSGSTLYGTTQNGGASNIGTVFKVNTNGTGYTVLKSFSDTDGGQPYAGLALSGSTLYGTTAYGGSSGLGTLFKLNTNGSGFTVLKNFSNTPDGSKPYGNLILSGTMLYGTTQSGGSFGVGTVFKITTNGTGYITLHNFTNNSDGSTPDAGLLLADSTLYGTTLNGGSSGSGTVFKVNTDGTGYAVLKNFSVTSGASSTNSGGAQPYASLILSGSTLYGTTIYGGGSGNGTVFKIDTNGLNFTVLKNFSATNGISKTNFDGAWPWGGLTISGSTLYGVAFSGGSRGYGTVFKVDVYGAGFTVLKNFTGHPDDGSYPMSGVTLFGGTLYGTTSGGGSNFHGTVFSLNAGKTAAIVTLGNLSQTYNGTARNATATTSPSGLTVVFTYNGSSSAPVTVGSYIVIGTISDVNYQGSVTNTLVIGLPPQNFTAGSTNNGQLNLQLTGTPNYPYILQLATNLTPLINWQSILTNSADANGNWSFTVSNLSGLPASFYRTVGQ